MKAAEGQLIFDARFLDPELPTGLWLCENALDVNAVQINAASLSVGGTWDDLNRCRSFIGRFCYLLVVCADPRKRKAMVEQVQMRVTYLPVLVAEDKAFRGCGSVADLRSQHGLQAVNEILLYTKELPAYGLLNLADVKTPDVSRLPKVYSGIQALDADTGGFLMGMLSVWTGRRGAGKSTLLGQLLLEAVDQGEVVCAYSGELMDWQFKHWITLQAAGPEYIKFASDPVSRQRVATLPVPVEKLIDEWLDRQFFLYDLGRASAHDGESILQVFEYAHRRFGASVFLVDNIMTARFRVGREKDFYRAQSEFVGRLVEFAKRNEVHVHLVAHPKKTEGKYLGADDVGGAGDITNRADNVFSLDRVEDRTELAILKNRMYGKLENIALEFDGKSKRFYRPKSKPEDKRFGWNPKCYQLSMEDAQEAEKDLPF